MGGRSQRGVSGVVAAIIICNRQVAWTGGGGVRSQSNDKHPLEIRPTM